MVEEREWTCGEDGWVGRKREGRKKWVGGWERRVWVLLESVRAWWMKEREWSCGEGGWMGG